MEIIHAESYQDLLPDVDNLWLKSKVQAEKLIECGFWEGIAYKDLIHWMGNFKTPEEKLLCALLLDRFNFKSSAQLKALIGHSLISCMPACFIKETSTILSQKLFETSLLGRKVSSDIRLVPVIRDSDPPTKSGPAVARLFKRLGGVNEKNMIWPWQLDEAISSGVNKIVFIDDTLATGDQFVGFLDRFFCGEVNKVCFGYIPLVAHVDGISNLNQKYPFISVEPVELADSSSSFFNQKNIPDLKDLYDSVAGRIFSSSFYKESRYGYGKLSLTVGFEHSTPNATLPLYWYSSESFRPLVRR